MKLERGESLNPVYISMWVTCVHVLHKGKCCLPSLTAALYDSAGHCCSLKEFLFGCILVIPRCWWGSSCLLSAVAPAQGLEAATQRVQYCWGLSLHASDSPSFSVTWAAGAQACNKLSGLMVSEALLWSNHTLWLGPTHVSTTFTFKRPV